MSEVFLPFSPRTSIQMERYYFKLCRNHLSPIRRQIMRASDIVVKQKSQIIEREHLYIIIIHDVRFIFVLRSLVVEGLAHWRSKKMPGSIWNFDLNLIYINKPLTMGNAEHN